MRPSPLSMLGGIRTDLFRLQVRHVTSKAGVSEVLKNSLHLRVNVSEYMDFDSEVVSTKKEAKSSNADLDAKFFPKPKRGPGVKSGKRFSPAQNSEYRERRERPHTGKPYPGKSYPGKSYPVKPYQGKPYQGKPYQGKPYQGQPYQGNQYQERPYQGKPYQRQPYQGQPYEGKPYHENTHAPYPRKYENLSTSYKTDLPTRTVEPVEFIVRCKNQVRPNDEELKQLHKPRDESIPKLAHKLDRVLFSPGVHFLQDPRTRVFNFNPYLKSIVSHKDFDFEKVQKFVSASKDKTLLQEAKEQNKKFYSSTSSMTLTLHQFYLFLNNYSPNPESRYRFDFPEFSRTAKELPLAVFVEPKGVNELNGETIYSVTSDKSTDVEILLSAMGHCLEALLTNEEEEFKELLIKRDDTNQDKVKEVSSESTSQPEPIPQTETAETAENVYNYLGYGDFLMRSQLDCYDSRLPGNGTFDLKTRAAASIRYDKSSEASDSQYQIWKLNGNTESFQREYEDLIRTGGLLKYGFQARIGQMDGIFVAYHNINSFFGFQYLPLSEIDKVFYSNNRYVKRLEDFTPAEEIEQDDNMASIFAESQFKASLNIWQDIMKAVEEDFKGTKFEGSPFRLVMSRKNKVKQKKPRKGEPIPRDGKYPLRVESVLSVFAVPLSRADVYKIQQVSSKYQTSFRENISDEERLANLEKIQSELDEFNTHLVRKNLLFSYVVDATLYVNGFRASGKEGHPYPYSSKDEIEWRYQIQRICGKSTGETTSEETKEADPVASSEQLVEQYLRATQMCTNMLTRSYKERPALKEPTLTDTLRKYSEVGKIRLEKWNELENPPRVY